jgi:hypothetical protein
LAGGIFNVSDFVLDNDELCKGNFGIISTSVSIGSSALASEGSEGFGISAFLFLALNTYN